MAVGRRGGWDEPDLPPLTVDLTASARTQDPLALSLYVANTFAGVLRASTDAERWAAADALGRCPGLVATRWFKEPRARERLRDEARRHGWPRVRTWLRKVVFPQAAVTVADEFEHPRRLCLGTGRDRLWFGDAEGRVVPMRPGQLSVVDGARWIRQAVRAQAAAILRDQAPAAPTDVRTTPEALRPLFRRLYQTHLSDRERALVRMWQAGRSTAEIAAALGCTPGAVRQARFRMQQKARP